jgi:hypothetical protein
MPKRRKMWVYSPPRQPKPKVPESIKIDLEKKAEALVETVLKPTHIKPPPEEARFNYIVDICTKWYRSYFYFCAKYHCPGPNAISPFFDTKFARLEYIGNSRFNLSFMRHTGKWVEIYTDLSADECLSAVEDDPFFYP